MPFVPYEREVISRLLGGRVLGEVLDVAVRLDLPVEVDETGVGYFAKAMHEIFPTERSVFSTPIVTGTFENITVGFVVFMHEHTLTLECHGFGDEVPRGARTLEWQIAGSAA
ncbi:MAG TPA: hypothetical protein VGI10_28370 [Polyangiaceae bacterium]|jgi:hypothetical protein